MSFVSLEVKVGNQFSELSILRGARLSFRYSGFPLVLCDVFHLPFRDKCFSLVFSQGVMEHYDEPNVIRGLSEQSRVGNIVIVDVPSEKAKGAIEAFGDERYWSWKKWKKLIERSGLKVIKTYGWGIHHKYRLLWYLLPRGLFRILSYLFTENIGFVCT